MSRTPLPFIVNPAAGSGKGCLALPLIKHWLAERGTRAQFWVTRRPGEATGIARGLHHSGAPVIVVVGGDGTVQEAANGVFGTDTALAIIPAGSGNDFVHALGIPNAIPEALKVALSGPVRTIDGGRVDGRRFVNVVGIGFDALVGAEKERAPLVRGTGAYLYGLAKALLRYRAPLMRIRLGDQHLQVRGFMVTVGNGVRCGSIFYLTPDAQLDDGLLDVCVVRDLSRLKLLWYLPKVLKGTHTGLDEVTMCRCRSVTVESDGPLMVHADGEVYREDSGRVDIEVIPRALRVVVPAQAGVSSCCGAAPSRRPG